MAIRTVDIYLSGGASNADPAASLGGIRSSIKLYGQTLSYSAGSMAGVALIDASGVSSGTLHFIKTGNFLGFQKAGGTVPSTPQSVVVGANGTYTIPSAEGDQFVTVAVTFASLPASDVTATVAAVSLNQNLFDDVTAAEANVGDIEYRHIYLYNASTSSVTATLFIKQQYTGLDYLEIGAKQLTSGVIDELLTNESTAPASVVFTAPDVQADGLVFVINQAEACGVYLKRTVTTLSDVSNPDDTAILVLDAI